MYGDQEILNNQGLLLGEFSIDFSDRRLCEVLSPCSTVLSDGFLGHIPEPEKKAFRVILRDQESIGSTVESILLNGIDYLSEKGVPMSRGNIDTCSAFLIPESVRDRVRKSPRLMNEVVSSFGSEFKGRVALLLVYDNTDNGITQVEGTEHVYLCDDFQVRLLGYYVINFCQAPLN